MNTAVIGTSRKENEKRVAIHPNHIRVIPASIRKSLFFEKGYGLPFGMTDKEIALLTGNRPMERELLFKQFGAFIMPKPTETDFSEMRDNSVVWGWIHSVQNENIAQIAIDKKMTLIAWENMYYTGKQGLTHIFQTNNEMAGYCGVQHALQLRGIDGNFGAQRKIAILSFGSVGRGAVFALKGHGFNDITVFTQRPINFIADKLPGIKYEHLIQDAAGSFSINDNGEKSIPLIDELTKSDIIINCILQNPINPVIWINDSDIKKFKKECMIIDISCDKGMGFSFAHPTDFAHPFDKIGNVLYYSLDHTPTILWDSASWEISNSLLPFLEDFISEKSNEVLDRATDIRNGYIINKDILSFQNRLPIYPYQKIDFVMQNNKALIKK